MKRLLFVLLSVIGLCLAAAYSYSFRKEEFDNPELGVFIFQYHWGRPVMILADTNRDGESDFRALVDGPLGQYSSHTAVPLEYWEDINFDGVFDHHVILDGGSIKIVKIDKDSNGHYEVTLEGGEALRFYEDRTHGQLDLPPGPSEDG